MHLLVLIFITGIFAAYDDLPKVANPYEPPGYEPESCPDRYSSIINALEKELGKNANKESIPNQLGSRVQKRFGEAHEILLATSDIQHKTNFNGTICRYSTSSGFNYILYPTPGNYDINNVKLEKYFEDFATFSSLKNKDITKLPKYPTNS